MRPALLCRARTTPTWFGRAPLHAAAISCCVLPVARARTLIPQRRRATLASRFSGCGALAPPSSRWSGSLSFRGRHFSRGRPPSRPALGVTREHTLGRLQFAELATELFALCIDPSQCLAETLLLFRDFIQCRHSYLRYKA